MSCFNVFGNKGGCSPPRVPSAPKGCGPANTCCGTWPAPPCTAASGVNLIGFDHAVKEYQCLGCDYIHACVQVNMEWQTQALAEGVWTEAGPGTSFFQTSSQWEVPWIPATQRVTHIRISATKLAAGGGPATLGTLPAAQRPTVNLTFFGQLSGGAGDQPGQVNIDATTGQVSISNSTGATDWQSVSAYISFSVSGP